MADVSVAAARLLYRHADDLHRWISRHDFMDALKGLKLHLGPEAYREFGVRFMEKTKGYPKNKSPKKSL